MQEMYQGTKVESMQEKQRKVKWESMQKGSKEHGNKVFRKVSTDYEWNKAKRCQQTK